jgi:phosphoglucosamine mutase
MVLTGKRASQLTQVFETVPQLLKNVRFEAGQAPLDRESVKAAISAAEAQLSGRGRLLIRKSGTEPLIRVMAECEDEALLERTVDSVVDAVAAAV